MNDNQRTDSPNKRQLESGDHELKSSTSQRSGAILRNISFNLIGRVVPIVVAVVTIPYIVSELGPSRYGIYALVGVILGYFNVFDFGMGRSITKFVAEALGKGDTSSIPPIFWTALVSVLSIGLVGSTVFVILGPFLAEHVFNIEPELKNEMRLVFLIATAGVLMISLKTALIGMLEAYQRFDVLNLIRTPSSVLTQVIAVAILALGGGLPLIVATVLLKDLAVILIYLYFAVRLMPRTTRMFAVDLKIVRGLLSFGGWLSILNISSYLTKYVDRLLIPAVITVTALTYYSVPFQVVGYASMIGPAVMAVLFPEFSALHVSDRIRTQELFWRSVMYLTLVNGLGTLLFLIFSKDLLINWLGDDFLQSVIVLQLFAISFFAGSISWIFSTLLQATGQMRAVALIGFAMVPVHIALSWSLTVFIGIEGAALATILPKVAVIALLYWVARHAGTLGPVRGLNYKSIRLIAIIASMAVGVFALKTVSNPSLLTSIILGILFVCGYLAVVWYMGVNAGDRRIVRQTLKKFVQRVQA